MNYYRITKYNPAFRDEQGFYTKNDCIKEHILSSKDKEFYIRIAELLQLDSDNIEMAVRLWSVIF